MAKKVGIAALVIVAVFLAGFVPQSLKRASLETELNDARRANREAQARDLAAYALVQASQKNFGLAAQTSTDFFGRLQQLASEETGNKAFTDILGYRDKITGELAKGDPAAVGDLQAVYLKTRAATSAK
jgi:hypothetical protein